MQEAEFELRDRIKELVRGKKFQELEEAWLQVIEGEPHPLGFHEALVRFLLNKKEQSRMIEMYALLLEARNKQGRHQLVLDVSQLILEIEPSLVFVRQHIVAAMKAMHADREAPRLAEMLKISGLDGDAPDLLKAVVRFEDLLGASRGGVFKHSQWGLGIVRELDPKEGWAVLDFPKKPNHKMTLEGIKGFLRRIPNDHVLARIARDPAVFRKEIFDDPCIAIKQALKSNGGKIKAQDLKKLLTDGFLSEDEYKRWWNKAKDEVRLDAHIDMLGKGASAELVLRKEPRSFVDEITVRLVEAKTLAERRAVLRDVDRHGVDADMSPQDHDAVTKLFLLPFENGAIAGDADRFAHGLLFEEFGTIFSDGAKNPVDLNSYLVRPTREVISLIGGVGIFELQRIALERVMEIREKDVPAVFSEVFFDADSRLVGWMERKLASKGSHDVMEQCLERILAAPERNSDLFIWAAKKALDGELTHVTEAMPPLEILRQALKALNHYEEQARRSPGEDQKEAVNKATKLRSFVQEGQGKMIKKIIRGATSEDARKFLASVSLLGGLTNQLRSMIEQVVFLEHLSLKKVSKQEEEESNRRPSFHYTTNDAIERKRKELSQIVNVEIPENSLAIGTARELGDLKENAEYHAAKDRQKLLMQQATELEELISRARIINLDDVKTDQVRFGTRVTVRRADNGEEETWTLLGIWEADADRRIVSYLTPFGSQLMNRSVGDKLSVTLPDGRQNHYVVVKIESAH